MAWRCDSLTAGLDRLTGSFARRYGVTEAEANKLLAANDEETLIEKILTKYLAYCERRDFVLVSRPAAHKFVPHLADGSAEVVVARGDDEPSLRRVAQPL